MEAKALLQSGHVPSLERIVSSREGRRGKVTAPDRSEDMVNNTVDNFVDDEVRRVMKGS